MVRLVTASFAGRGCVAVAPTNFRQQRLYARDQSMVISPVQAVGDRLAAPS